MTDFKVEAPKKKTTFNQTVAKPTDFELDVCKAIIKSNSQREEYEYYGDEFYPFARRQTPFFKDTKIELTRNHKNKKEKIVYENSVRLIEENLNPRKNIFNMNMFIVPSICTSKILELRGLCFIYFSNFIISKQKDTDIPFIFSIIVSLQRFILTICEEHISNFSSIALEDLQNISKKLVSTFNFNGATLHKIAPSLISSSPFDKYIPKEAITPYTHQIEAPKLLENMKDGFVDIYNTSTNSGKTFTTVGIAHRVKEMKVVYPDLEFIFCCEIQSVRQKVAQLLHYSDISTGIAVRKPNGEYIMKNMSRNRIAIVCNCEFAIKILQVENAREKYVLFIDEITMEASNIDSKVLRNYMQVFSLAPKWVYVSNANLPSDDRIQFMIDYHHKTFPLSRFETTSSNTIFSCSTVETFSKQSILPHMSCDNVKDLKLKLTSIYENQFKGKMYNPSAIRILYDRIIKMFSWSLTDDGECITKEEKEEIRYWKDNLPDIDTLFGDVSQLYADNIRKIAMKMLEVLIEFNDDYVVKTICSIPKGVPCNSTDFLVNLPLHEYQNVTLIAHPDPVNFATVMFKDILSEIKGKIGSLHKLHQSYNKKLEDWQKEYEKIPSKYKNEQDISIAQTEMSEDKPRLSFPEELQINTNAFLKKRGLSKENPRFPIQIENINIDKMDNEDLILLLYAGVGVYTETTNPYYRKTVLEFMSEGRLEFILSDVCYGMDYPIGCLFISKDFSDTNGLNTIYQLMSRVGRGRMSYMGHIYIDESCVSRILDPIDETSSVELKNMEKILHLV